MVLFSVLFVFSAGKAAQPGAPAGTAPLEKAKAEGKASFYANITAVEPLMEDFTKRYGVKGEYTRISTAKFVTTAITERGASLRAVAFDVASGRERLHGSRW